MSSPPDGRKPGFYGWRIVASCFLVQFTTVGTTFYAYGVLLKPLTEALGASRFAVGSALPMLMLVGALAAPLIGREVDRRGARSLMLVGAACLTAGFLAFSQIDSVAGLYGSFAIVACGGALLGPIPNTTLVANWFVRQRGTALGISQIGISLSGIALAYLTTWLVVEHGWRTAALCFAAAPLVAIVPVVALAVVNRPEDCGQLPDGRAVDPAAPPPPPLPAPGSLRQVLRQAFRERDLWVIALVMGLNFACGGTMMQAIHSHVTDLGHSAAGAASVLAMMAGMAALGKPVFGTLADRTSPRSAMMIAIALQAAGVLALLLSSGYAALLAAAFVFGLGFGALMPLFGLLIAARFGAARLGRMMGSAGPLMLPFQLLGLPFATAIFDRSGSYLPAFAVFVALYLIALAILTRLPTDEPPPALS